MPWKETSAMEQRIEMLADWLSGDYGKSELCRIYGISRPTADKWIRRHEQRGLPGLAELRRAPHRHPNQTGEELRALIVQTKLERQKWGPKKVLDWLRDKRPELKWPADSSPLPRPLPKGGEQARTLALQSPRYVTSAVFAVKLSCVTRSIL